MPAPQTRRKSTAQARLEAGLIGARWLTAPFYLGLVVSLGLLLALFARELWTELTHLPEMTSEDGILAVLSLIDLSLAANLVLIVIFSGYENFVSRIDTAEGQERPAWMGTVDFTGLKMKLIASIVAISAIALLRAFMELAEPTAVLHEQKLRWLVVIHLTFLASGVMMAVMDWLVARSGGQR